jgi:hypothetical protein
MQSNLHELLEKEGLSQSEFSFSHPRMTLEQLYLKTVADPARKN